MSLPRIKLTLPSDLREYIDQRVRSGGVSPATSCPRAILARSSLADRRAAATGRPA
jgi:hypothetical protein